MNAFSLKLGTLYL